MKIRLREMTKLEVIFLPTYLPYIFDTILF